MTTPTLPPVAPGTVQVWSDLLDPFAHLALHRLRQARERLGIPVAVEHRTFALELFNGPHPRRGTDTEAVGVGQAAPELDWRVWAAADDVYPHTVLLAAEAVQGAQAQSLAAGEALDYGHHRRTIAADHEIAVTDAVPGSATFRLADGRTVHNPGTEVEWAGPWAAGFPRVTDHDPHVFDGLLGG